MSQVKKDIKAKTRLIDCFTEIMTYTLYLVQYNQLNQSLEKITKSYQDLLERSKMIAHSSKIPSTEWKKGLFPVCAWIDEKILCSELDERHKWKQNQLQVLYFQTSNAGKEFFSRLEKLKDSEREVREVYTYCLSLGFQGMYYTEEEQMRLSEVKTDNLLKYFSEDQDLSLPKKLFPYAYQKEIQKKKRKHSRGTSLLSFFLFGLPPLLFAGLYVLYYYKLDKYLFNLFGIK